MNAPKQWTNLIKEYPEFAPGRAAVQVALTEELHDQLATVHHDVRAHYPYSRDLVSHGQADIWLPAIEGRGGDCEDLSLRMWLQLLEWGWDSASFSLCLCRGPAGPHAVLLVHSDHGFVVLDPVSWMPAAMPDLTWDLSFHTGYRWLYRSDPDAETWALLWIGEGLGETQVMHPELRDLNRAWSARRYGPR